MILTVKKNHYLNWLHVKKLRSSIILGYSQIASKIKRKKRLLKNDNINWLNFFLYNKNINVLIIKEN